MIHNSEFKFLQKRGFSLKSNLIYWVHDTFMLVNITKNITKNIKNLLRTFDLKKKPKTIFFYSEIV